MDLRQLEILRAIADTGSFTAAGAQPYFCRPHERMGMKGVVTVL